VKAVFSDYAPSNASLSPAEAERLRRAYPPGKGGIARQDEGEGTVWYWFPDREAPAEDVAALTQLRGYLKPGTFLTKMRKSFLVGEMVRDLEIVPADPEFRTEYLRILPQSPP